MCVNVIVTHDLKIPFLPTFAVSSLSRRSVLTAALAFSCFSKVLWVSTLLRYPIHSRAFTITGGGLPRLSTIP